MKKRLMTGIICLVAVLCGNVRECRAEEVERQVVVEGIEAGLGVPEEILVEYEDIKEYVPVKSVQALREYWTGDFEFPVLFYVYDAEYYELGEYRIPRREDAPGLEGYEDGLLKTLGLEEEDYVIEKVTWSGEAYVNEEGILCRDAVARGRKRLRDYEVVYGMEEELEPDVSAAYPEEMQMMVDAPDQVVRVTGTVDDEGAGNKDFWSILKRVTVVTVAAGLVLLILLLVLLLCMKLVKWYRDRKREKSEEKRKDVFDYYGG